MAELTEIRVEVAYARPDVQRLLTIAVPVGTTAREVVRRSGLAAEFAEIDVDHCPLGVFGRPVNGDCRVHDGDRVEIYRPLQRDPREARRELAARGLTMGATDGDDAPQSPDHTGSTGTSR